MKELKIFLFTPAAFHRGEMDNFEEHEASRKICQDVTDLHKLMKENAERPINTNIMYFDSRRDTWGSGWTRTVEQANLHLFYMPESVSVVGKGYYENYKGYQDSIPQLMLYRRKFDKELMLYRISNMQKIAQVAGGDDWNRYANIGFGPRTSYNTALEMCGMHKPDHSSVEIDPKTFEARVVRHDKEQKLKDVREEWAESHGIAWIAAEAEHKTVDKIQSKGRLVRQREIAEEWSKMTGKPIDSNDSDESFEVRRIFKSTFESDG